MTVKHWLFMALAFAMASPLPATADDGTDNVRAHLVPDVESIKPGEPFRVGVVLEMARAWHTYWRNPGDSGLATTIDWDLPEGFEASDIAWPYPHWLDLQGLVSLSYGDTVVLPVTIIPPAGLEPGSEVELKADVDWLECKEMCLPGGASLTLKLPVGDGAKAAGDTAKTFAKTDRSLPVDGASWDNVNWCDVAQSWTDLYSEHLRNNS